MSINFQPYPYLMGAIAALSRFGILDVLWQCTPVNVGGVRMWLKQMWRKVE
jgi:hypothetical protein